MEHCHSKTTDRCTIGLIRLLTGKCNDVLLSGVRQIPGARFTKYLTTHLRLSYDDAKVMIDLRRASNLPIYLTIIVR